MLPITAEMTPRLTLGYRAAVAPSGSVLAPVGTSVHGHEFHRTHADPPAGAAPAWQWSAAGPEGFVQDGVHASYLHLNWAGSPELAERFVGSCATRARTGRSEQQHAHR